MLKDNSYINTKPSTQYTPNYKKEPVGKDTVMPIALLCVSVPFLVLLGSSLASVNTSSELLSLWSLSRCSSLSTLWITHSRLLSTFNQTFSCKRTRRQSQTNKRIREEAGPVSHPLLVRIRLRGRALVFAALAALRRDRVARRRGGVSRGGAGWGTGGGREGRGGWGRSASLRALWAGSRESEDGRGEQLGVAHGHQLTGLQDVNVKATQKRPSLKFTKETCKCNLQILYHEHRNTLYVL